MLFVYHMSQILKIKFDNLGHLSACSSTGQSAWLRTRRFWVQILAGAPNLIDFFLMIRRPPRSTLSSSSAASDVYKRQQLDRALGYGPGGSGFKSQQAHQNYIVFFCEDCKTLLMNFINNLSLQKSVITFFIVILVVLLVLTFFL